MRPVMAPRVQCGSKVHIPSADATSRQNPSRCRRSESPASYGEDESGELFYVTGTGQER
jgi:hypothetical protein